MSCWVAPFRVTIGMSHKIRYIRPFNICALSRNESCRFVKYVIGTNKLNSKRPTESTDPEFSTFQPPRGYFSICLDGVYPYVNDSLT